MRKLGDYTLTRRLGVGGMGEVWMGRREAIGGAARDVAIKLLSAERASNAEARRMFLDEARLSMLLRNSNIVQVHNVAETDDKTCYMVMEFVEGLNVAELSEKMREASEAMPDSIIAFIIGEVLKGLAHAHELRLAGERKTVVHRDVSPHNVMLSVFGEVKVMDFGIARVASEDTSGVHVKGKLRYMPPEQLRGETREPTLDLFAVGAMLHELLDGEKFRGNVIDEGRLFGMIFAGEIPEFRRAPETIPKELDELRRALLEPEPKDRIQSARQAFRRLTAWSGYRDTRFELDELVRRYVGQDEPVPAIPGTTVIPAELAESGEHAKPDAGTREALVPPPVEPLAVAAGSFTAGSFPGQDGGATVEATATELLPSEGSDTDISRVRDSGTDMVVAARVTPSPQPRNRSKFLAAGLAVLGLVGVGIGASAMAGVWSGDADEAEVADADTPDRVVGEGEGAREPTTADEDVDDREHREPTPTSEPVAPEPDAETGGAIETPDEDQAPKQEPPPEPTPEPPEDPEEPAATAEPKPQPVSRTKVAIRLGSGVAWAEVKLGGRTYELDAFAGKGASARLKPGSYGVSCRMQVDGAWKIAGRVTIPEGKVTMRLGKGCTVSVE